MKPDLSLASSFSSPIETKNLSYERRFLKEVSPSLFEGVEIFSLFCRNFDHLDSSRWPSRFGTWEDWQEILEDAKKRSDCLSSILLRSCDLFRVSTEKSLFTGYFEPVLKGSRVRSDLYRYPVYSRPPELMVIEDLGAFNERCAGIRIAGTIGQGTLHPYLTREEINGRILETEILCYTDDPYKLYFMHVQGSGLIRLKEGGKLRLSYDGTNGYPYTSIGRLLIDRGAFSEEACSMEAVLRWLESHPQEARALLHQNQSYVFFKENKSEGPVGSFGLPLVPLRSLAVDPRFIPLGCPLLLKTPSHRGVPPLCQFMFAHDVGGAIKGPARGDIFWGSGEEAGRLAGLTKTTGELFLILPKSATLDQP